jgi:uncharacterized protein YbjT (DUF2867 family)
MKLLVIGASRGTGAEAVRAALARGYEVTAFARSPEKLALEDPKLGRIKGDFHVRESVDSAVPGHDAVILTASATTPWAFRKDPTYFSRGTALTIDAMKAHGVRRFVVLSALGTGESRVLFNFFLDHVVRGFLLKLPYADHERQEQLVRESGLEWVLARPSRLTNGPARNKYLAKATIEPVPMTISRADTADFMVRAAVENTWNGQAVQLGG